MGGARVCSPLYLSIPLGSVRAAEEARPRSRNIFSQVGCPGAVAVKGQGCPHCVDAGADLGHRAGVDLCPRAPRELRNKRNCGEHFLVRYMPLAAKH